MFAATAVTVQLAVLGRAESGLIAIELVPEPLTPKVCGLLLHETVNELVVTSTDSLKLTVMFAAGSTSVAPSAGVVVVTAGGAAPRVRRVCSVSLSLPRGGGRPGGGWGGGGACRRSGGSR